MRALRRIWLFVPGSAETVAHTSVSGPYWLALRQPVQVDVFEQASVFEVVKRPVSPEPLRPFDQRPASESGFSLARSKLSTEVSGSLGSTRSAGVADVSPESGLSPFAFCADTL